jgi:ligand-binding sensor domain-containing protein/serine phosphatase RsbU (regulator of sigma subunit)
MNKLFIVLASIIILSQNYLTAQPPNIKFEHITLEDGLSQSSIYSIVQDNKGFMWFATLDGLNKYDGYGITIYRNNPADSNSISDNVLNFLFVDKPEYGGNLWIGTRGAGLCKFDETFDIFKAYRPEKENLQAISSINVQAIWGEKDYLWVATSDGLSRLNRNTETFKQFHFKDKKGQNSIHSIVPGKNNQLWLGTDNGLCLFNKADGKSEFFDFQLSGKPTIGINKINAVQADKNNNLWIGTDNGLIKFNKDSKEYKIFQHKKSKLSRFVSNKITSIVIDKDDIIWLATEKSGLYRLNPKNDEFSAYKNDASIRSSLQSNNLLSLYQDQSDILWIGSSLAGVDKWNRAADELSLFRHNPYDENSLSSNQVRNIYEDSNGRIWIGTVQGGLNLWLKDENKFKHYLNIPNKPSSLSHNHVRTILEDSKGRFWVGTDGGGLNRFYPETGKFKTYKQDDTGKTTDAYGPGSNRIWRIIESTDGNIWLATYGGGINIFNPETGKFQIYKNTEAKNSLSNDNATTVFEDHLGNIWIGTFGGGLNRWDKKTKGFIRYRHDPKDKKSIGTNRIYAINEDSKGRLWIGQKGALSLYNRDSNDFENFDENNNFPNNVMMGILEDRNGNIWVSTNSGLSKFNPETKKVRNYDIRDGLQSNEFLTGSFCKTKEGNLMFGGINGFNSFDPDKMVDNTNLPSVVITGFQISNQTVRFDTTISNKKLIILNHRQNDISFDFVALDYIFPEKNQYKYKLIGYDEDWVDIKFKRYATYTNLSPGNYVFKVIGSNNDEIWNTEGTEIAVVIEPAFWQRLWFQALGTVLLISIVLTWFYLRIRRIKQQNEYLEEQVRLRTAEIREQQREIMDSIVYAKRIQTAALPVENYAKEIVSEHFVLFKPKDIVSGDFYWIGQKNGKTIIIAADCTGHGVPGAFMSMLGISFLNKIVNEKGVTEPNEILNKLRDNVIYALHQTGAENESKDGMDITVCTILHNEMKLQFAGANNPLYFIHNGEMQVVKGDKMPVAYYDFMQPFKLHELKIEKTDVFYLFSDGYADQFGGPKGKKFMYKPFRRLLSEISDKPMEAQKQALDVKIEEWRGDIEQVDDIVVLGVRI